jgi:predicted nucleotidyltransferase
MKPSVALDLKRSAVREAAGRFRAANPRVFGSALHGTDQDGSDLDLLVDALPGATLFDLGGLQVEPEELLGVTPGVPWRSMRGMRNRIAHGYFDIDLDAVWNTVDTALPERLKALEF